MAALVALQTIKTSSSPRYDCKWHMLCKKATSTILEVAVELCQIRGY